VTNKTNSDLFYRNERRCVFAALLPRNLTPHPPPAWSFTNANILASLSLLKCRRRARLASRP